MARKQTPEGAVLKQVLQYLQLRGAFVYRQNQGAVRASYKGKERLVRFASAKGVSDVIGCLNGRFIAVETKAGRNKATPDQEAFLASVRAAGGVAVVAYSVEDVVAALEGL